MEDKLTPSEKMTMMKAATLGLIRKIEREDLIVHDAIEVYETLKDHMIANYPEFNSEENDHCIYYAMQACLF